MFLEWVKFKILKDSVTITLDTTGDGLHKRGYRVDTVKAPIKETLAAAMVNLSFWHKERLLVDPFCGSGTIAIEAAMIAKNIAPGLHRQFAAEQWDFIPEHFWEEEREKAFDAIDNDSEIRIEALDIDPRAIRAAKKNAEEAGVEDCIEFKVMDVKDYEIQEESGIIICNPPYGERIGEQEEIENIYRELTRILADEDTWSVYLITADKSFEAQFKFGDRPQFDGADRRRKLYNGRIETCYYQYYGKRPNKRQN